METKELESLNVLVVDDDSFFLSGDDFNKWHQDASVTESPHLVTRWILSSPCSYVAGAEDRSAQSIAHYRRIRFPRPGH